MIKWLIGLLAILAVIALASSPILAAVLLYWILNPITFWERLAAIIISISFGELTAALILDLIRSKCEEVR